jgi:hypothetical protein
MTDQEQNSAPQPAQQPAPAPAAKSASWPKWLIAGLAVATIGVGVGVADWVRDGRGGSHGGYGGYGRYDDGGQRGMRGQAGLQRMCERDPLRFEGVVRAFVKADLDLKAEQNAELDKLATALVPALKDLRDEVCNNFAQSGATLTSPERLERLAVILRKAADTADKSVAPAKSFYATLDDKQKARVDEMVERRHRFGHGHGERGHGERGHGGRGHGEGERGR